MDFYIDLYKGTINTAKLVKRSTMVRGKNGKVFTRQQWVNPNDASTGHGVRHIGSKSDMMDAQRHGIAKHPDYHTALKEQGINLDTHDFKHHPPFHLPETSESHNQAERGGLQNHIPHGTPNTKDHHSKGTDDDDADMEELDWDLLSDDELDAMEDEIMSKRGTTSKESPEEHQARQDKILEELSMTRLKRQREPRDKNALAPKDRKEKIYNESMDALSAYIGKGTPVHSSPLVKKSIKSLKTDMEEMGYHEEDLEEILADLQESAEIVFKGMSIEGIERALSHPDGNYSLKFKKIEPYDDEDSGIYPQQGRILDKPTANMKFTIHDSEGRSLGETHRVVSRLDNGDIEVYNALLTISHDMQGSGTAEHLYDRMENLWGHMASQKSDDNKAHLKVTANMDVGVYAWAMKGFDFESDKERKSATTELSKFLSENSIEHDNIFKHSGISSLDELKTARDFATLDDGYEYNLEPNHKGVGHLGKAFMLKGKSNWSGNKTLNFEGDVVKSFIHKSTTTPKEVRTLKWSKEKEYVGKEGLTLDADGKTTHNDYWLHASVMEPKADKIEKGRKSVGSLDVVTKKVPTKQQQLIIDLGLEGVADDVVTKVAVRKSPELVIDLAKANNSHLPEKADRFSYKCSENYNIVFIPVNRLKQVYQTDDALNPSTVSRKAKEMKSGKEMPPVYIGYDYDVHDGHHSWHAAIKNDYTHVPCKVVGKDPEKVKEALNRYKEVWKSEDISELFLNDFIEHLKGETTEKGFREDHWQPKPKQKLEKTDKNPMLIVDENQRIDPVEDEKLWKEQVDENDKEFRSKLGIEKSLETVGELSFVLDLSKAINTGKLVKKRTMVRGKAGKVFYRMQWVDPNDKSANMEHPGVDHSTYAHHEDGVKDLERRQSNKFPVVHHPTNELKNTEHNYNTDKAKYDEAEKKLKAGEKLPPVKVNHKGEILENHHLVDLAKKHGLTHVPSLIMGNTELKKKLEDKLKDKVVAKDEDDKMTPVGGKEDDKDTSLTDNHPNQGGESEMVADVEQFRKFTTKKYTKQHLMQTAREHGLTWKENMNDGTPLGENSAILWMHAQQAMVNFIKAGNKFEVKHNEKDVTKRMSQDGKDSVHKHFLKLYEKHGSKAALIEWAKNNDIQWKEQQDPSINWKNLVVELKSQLAKGKMVDGIRTRQKDAMKEANTVITDQIKATVKALGSKHGKVAVMAKADELGIDYPKVTKKGEPLGLNNNVLWMKASAAISKYIAQGGEFKMAGDEDSGIVSQTGDYGDATISKAQGLALDQAKRNSHKMEERLKKWAMKALMVDRELDESQAEELYNQFMQKARDKQVMVHFDPHELLPSGSTLLEQLSSDGVFRNDYELNRGLDKETREINERDMFGDDYDEATDKERPTYGVADMFNQGLGSNKYSGEVAFVLKPEMKKRVTGSAIGSNNIPYGEEGRHVRSMEDPHHLIIDRWRSRWKNVNKKDAQRSRMFDSVLEGTTHHEDTSSFETHVHGGIKFDKDVDHILVPKSWKSDSQHKEKHDNIKNFANQFGLDVKYEG